MRKACVLPRGRAFPEGAGPGHCAGERRGTPRWGCTLKGSLWPGRTLPQAGNQARAAACPSGNRKSGLPSVPWGRERPDLIKEGGGLVPRGDSSWLDLPPALLQRRL